MGDKKRETLPVDHRLLETPVALHIVGSEREVPLPPEAGGTLRIGTDPGNDLVLDDRFVSAHHCVLERRERRVVVRDRSSKNGTFVNGSRVHESDLAPGA